MPETRDELLAKLESNIAPTINEDEAIKRLRLFMGATQATDIRIRKDGKEYEFQGEFIRDTIIATLALLEPGWRADMENAPRDGTQILVWREHEHGFERARIGVDSWSDRHNAWYHSRRLMQPTHWMPLPDAPQPKSEGERDG